MPLEITIGIVTQSRISTSILWHTLKNVVRRDGTIHDSGSASTYRMPVGRKGSYGSTVAVVYAGTLKFEFQSHPQAALNCKAQHRFAHGHARFRDGTADEGGAPCQEYAYLALSLSLSVRRARNLLSLTSRDAGKASELAPRRYSRTVEHF